MHHDHDIFIKSIHSRRQVRVTFVRRRDSTRQTRLCAPMDFGPRRKSRDISDRYHFWDYEGESGPHVSSLMPDQVLRIETTEFTFDPADFVTWDLRESPWFVARDWGRFS